MRYGRTDYRWLAALALALTGWGSYDTSLRAGPLWVSEFGHVPLQLQAMKRQGAWMEITEQDWRCAVQSSILDRLEPEGLETLLDDWRCVMKECARAGMTTLAGMAESRCDWIHAELSARWEPEQLSF